MRPSAAACRTAHAEYDLCCTQRSRAGERVQHRWLERCRKRHLYGGTGARLRAKATAFIRKRPTLPRDRKNRDYIYVHLNGPWGWDIHRPSAGSTSNRRTSDAHQAKRRTELFGSDAQGDVHEPAEFFAGAAGDDGGGERVEALRELDVGAGDGIGAASAERGEERRVSSDGQSDAGRRRDHIQQLLRIRHGQRRSGAEREELRDVAVGGFD